MAELWVEVLSLEEARKTPMPNLSAGGKEEFEIRLVIWETNNVPIMNGK